MDRKKHDYIRMLGLEDEIKPVKKPRGRKKPNLNPVAQAIAKERVLLGYTQKDLAQRAGVNFDTVRRVEQGSMGVTIGTLMKLLSFLELSIAIEPNMKRI